MTFKKLANRWVDEVFNQSEKIDPYDELDWKSLALGWALGNGCTLKQGGALVTYLLSKNLI